MSFGIYGETGDAGTNHANDVMDAAVDGQGDDPIVWTEVAGAGGGMVTVSGAAEATQKILQQAQASRRPPGPVRVVSPEEEVDEEDPVADAFDVLFATAANSGGVWTEIIGFPGTVEVNGDARFQSPAEALPITQRLYRYFSAAAPAPKLVRVDTEASYQDFIAQKVEALSQRVDDLEHAVADHVADGHGGQSTMIGWDEVVGVSQRTGGALNEIPLSLPPYCEGLVHCWQEGDAICCSICLPGPDGNPRVATTSTPIAQHDAEVLGYVHDSGVDPLDVVGVLPTLVLMLGGGGLVPQLARASSGLLADPEASSGQPYLRKVIPTNDRTLATAMALRNLANRGDGAAKTEWAQLETVARSAPPLAVVLAEAVKRLAGARK